MEFIISAKTEVGIARAGNQDSYMVRIYHTGMGNITFAILCDGMGGLAQGEVASASLVKAFGIWSDERLCLLCERKISEQEIYREWMELINRYNRKIQAYGRQEGIRLGSTLTAMLITSHQFYIVHVGDTRAYEISKKAVLLTTDQTVAAREVEQGRLTLEEARDDVRKNILWQCVGASKEVQPEFISGEVKKEAVYLLCSDGFWHKITEEELLETIDAAETKKEETLEEKLNDLIQRNMERKEQDNMSAILISTY